MLRSVPADQLARMQAQATQPRRGRALALGRRRQRRAHRDERRHLAAPAPRAALRAPAAARRSTTPRQGIARASRPPRAGRGCRSARRAECRCSCACLRAGPGPAGGCTAGCGHPSRSGRTDGSTTGQHRTRGRRTRDQRAGRTGCWRAGARSLADDPGLGCDCDCGCGCGLCPRSPGERPAVGRPPDGLDLAGAGGRGSGRALLTGCDRRASLGDGRAWLGRARPGCVCSPGRAPTAVRSRGSRSRRSPDAVRAGRAAPAGCSAGPGPGPAGAPAAHAPPARPARTAACRCSRWSVRRSRPRCSAVAGPRSSTP